MASMAAPPSATDASRKYQLFPKLQGAASDAGLGHSPSLRLRKDPSSSGSGSTRRRKVNVPDIEPMTTVQEAAMDSPTIPGLRPTMDRSVSAPNNGRAHIFNLANASESGQSYGSGFSGAASIKRDDSPSKNLAPLMIPKSSLRSAASVSSRFRNGSSTLDSASSSLSSSASSSSGYTPNSNYTYRAEVSPAGRRSPQIAHQYQQESRLQPSQWERATTPPAGSPPSVPSKSPINSAGPTSLFFYAEESLHKRDPSDSSSSSSASRIMDRGRPRKRSPSNSTTSTAATTISQSSTSDFPSPKRSPSSERRAFEFLPSGMTLSSAAATLSSPELLSLRAQAHEQACRFEVLRAADVDELSRELRALDERAESLGTTYVSMRGTRRNLHGRVMTLLRARPRVSLESLVRQEEALCELDASIDEWMAKMATTENRRTRVRQKLLEHVAAASMISIMQPGVPPKDVAPVPAHHHLMSTISTPPRSPVKSALTPLITQNGDREVIRSVSTSALRNAAIESATASLQAQTQLPPRSSSIRRPGMGLPTPSTPSAPISSLFSARNKTESIYIYAGSDVFGLAPVTEAAPPPPPASEKATKLATAVHKLRDTERRQMQRSRSHEVLPSTSFESPRKSPTPPTPTYSAKLLQPPSSSAASVRSFSDLPLLSSMAFVPGSTSASSTPAPSPAPREEPSNNDTSVLFLTSAVFSG
ncbi:uncharacterized protein BROUX77_006630 [Berkeleyomyces rouxiae]|uniref:uncharacterized protein n=1 Tax=Berkeleyomyces rouxiae TaxID=2035830 RepID=UPI003B80EFC8